MTSMMLEREDGDRFADVTAQLAKLSQFASIPANCARPIGGSWMGEGQAEAESSFTNPSCPGAPGDSNDAKIRESGICLLQATVNGAAGDTTRAGGAAQFLFFQRFNNGRGIQEGYC